ncbi:MAG TPA: fibronectin type III domain-containing protein [Vicinamibacterales bacterium]|nr:fibronectin type III domain-containing protein [Vicinamibacterales bacterium]
MLIISTDRAQAAEPMRFGSDIESIDRATSRGLALSYGSFWVGSWTQKYGWGYAQDQMRAAAARNVTPVIHWWYWGDDISPTCVERGCFDGRQGVQKDKATWYRMTAELSQLIAQTMGNREVVVIVETEFNKGGIETYPPFDQYLSDQAAILHQRGNVKVVVGFGNWGRENWSRFSRSIGSADYLGAQLLRSSLRDGSYGDAVGSIISSARYLQGAFGKPTFITDLALSSYPTSNFEQVQANVFANLFSRMNELKDAGVRGVIYRMMMDDPGFDTANYHGEAERHWGLLRADGSEKPAFSQFVAGLRREQSGTPAPTANPAPPAGPTANVPNAPANFRSQVNGGVVTMQWDAAASASSYLIEAGSASGLTNLATVEVGATGIQVNAPPGTYFVRVRARNGSGLSGGSNEQIVQVR